MIKLTYKVECKSTYVFFELIAAFNCESAAVGYAGECAESNPSFHYRVMKGRRVVLGYGPLVEANNLRLGEAGYVS
jgi:hypothetical protein